MALAGWEQVSVRRLTAIWRNHGFPPPHPPGEQEHQIKKTEALALSQLQGRTSRAGDEFRQRADPSPFLDGIMGESPHHVPVLLKDPTEGSTVVMHPHHFLSRTT